MANTLRKKYLPTITSGNHWMSNLSFIVAFGWQCRGLWSKLLWILGVRGNQWLCREGMLLSACGSRVECRGLDID